MPPKSSYLLSVNFFSSW